MSSCLVLEKIGGVRGRDSDCPRNVENVKLNANYARCDAVRSVDRLSDRTRKSKSWIVPGVGFPQVAEDSLLGDPPRGEVVVDVHRVYAEIGAIASRILLFLL
jgi:hypothetical protein